MSNYPGSDEVEPVALVVADGDEPARGAWAETLVRWLDDGVRIPGTDIGIGLDPIIGFFFPGAGDVLTGAGSVALLFRALGRGVPTIVLLRMLVNIAVDVMFGAIPFVGDLFDVFYRCNRRNLELIERYESDPDARPSAIDYVVVGFALLLVLLNIAIPIFVVYGLGTLFS